MKINDRLLLLFSVLCVASYAYRLSPAFGTFSAFKSQRKFTSSPSCTFSSTQLPQTQRKQTFHRSSSDESSVYDDEKVYPAIGGSEQETSAKFDEYKRLWKQSLESPDLFWNEAARNYLSWFKEPQSTKAGLGSFDDGDVNFFAGGKLNAAYNCIDRHLASKGDDVAIIWEADEPGQGKKITFNEMAREVSKIANLMKESGVKKGDVVTIYMPMIPEIAFVMLACTRIGAVHSVVFAGFSSDALANRILNCNSNFLFTADQGLRGGKAINLKQTVDEAVKISGNMVSKVFIFKRTGNEVPFNPDRDVWMDEELPRMRPYCPVEEMDSEDPMFVLYTSGSTGKPKGVLHSTAGYLLNAAMTTKNSFDLKEGDIYACVADAGWITGHTYLLYGPLVNGVTTVLFESVPTYPDPYRYWDLIQTHKVTQFYTAPTAIRALMRFDAAPIANYDLSSLRVLGSVGEPINPEAWRWYYDNVGKEKCTIVDTYWQTETGAHLATNLPGAAPMKPGSCALPCYGIDFAVLDPSSGKELSGNEVEGVLAVKKIFPSVARTVYGDHDRYLNVYLKPYPGYYFTGDGCRRDKDGYYYITGRVDDVINPSGHRLGTAEVESALVAVDEVSEAAVVGFPHEVKGEGIGCYVILKAGISGSADLTKKLKGAVRSSIGPIATPDFIVYSDLPKTRSGKIMRRILRKVAAGEEDSIGDTSTLADQSVVPLLVERYKEAKAMK